MDQLRIRKLEAKGFCMSVFLFLFLFSSFEMAGFQLLLFSLNLRLFPPGVIWDTWGALALVVDTRDRDWVFVVATCCTGERNTNGGRFQHFFSLVPFSSSLLPIFSENESESGSGLLFPTFSSLMGKKTVSLLCLFTLFFKKTRKWAALRGFACLGKGQMAVEQKWSAWISLLLLEMALAMEDICDLSFPSLKHATQQRAEY